MRDDACVAGGYVGPLYVIVEYAPHGNLRDFLRQNRPSGMSSYEEPVTSSQQHDDGQGLTNNDLVSFAFQVARGAEYLSSKLVSVQSAVSEIYFDINCGKM